ncbi:hypothetical protein B0H13DRAFT_2337884 [Mycena leptocephala]|nr:hypothetical protein B0H13DRAFT_2337884 [Mycena leptocephala]
MGSFPRGISWYQLGSLFSGPRPSAVASPHRRGKVVDADSRSEKEYYLMEVTSRSPTSGVSLFPLDSLCSTSLFGPGQPAACSSINASSSIIQEADPQDTTTAIGVRVGGNRIYARTDSDGAYAVHSLPLPPISETYLNAALPPRRIIKWQRPATQIPSPLVLPSHAIGAVTEVSTALNCTSRGGVRRTGIQAQPRPRSGAMESSTPSPLEYCSASAQSHWQVADHLNGRVTMRATVSSFAYPPRPPGCALEHKHPCQDEESYIWMRAASSAGAGVRRRLPFVIGVRRLFVRIVSQEVRKDSKSGARGFSARGGHPGLGLVREPLVHNGDAWAPGTSVLQVVYADVLFPPGRRTTLRIWWMWTRAGIAMHGKRGNREQKRVRLATTPRQRWFSTLDAWPVAYTLTYLSGFTVQIYFASRVHRLTRETVMLFRLPAFGIYVADSWPSSRFVWTPLILQTWPDGVHPFFSHHDIADCRVVCLRHSHHGVSRYFLARNKNEMSRSNTMLNTLMVNTINRGMLTALSSGLTLVSRYRETFWFLLSLAPNSKLYMNSMFAMLNMRKHVQAKIDQGWENINLNDARSATNAPLEFVKSPDLLDTDPVDLPSCDLEEVDCPTPFLTRSYVD